MTAFRRAVLMGDPACFEIRGGANPHTRDRWGRKKKVALARAAGQWHSLARTLGRLGVDVYVVPARLDFTGLVYPANAGFLTRLDEALPVDQKTFVLSRSIPTRAEEGEVFAGFLKALGFRVEPFPKRFEGEADFFPAGEGHIFTSGPVEKQRFVPQWGWPPYRRVYGFRSQADALAELRVLVPGRRVLPLTLVRETHYHGDTCLCAFGPKREFLMAYLPALASESQDRLKQAFGDRLLPLGERDGELFSANSFQVDEPGPVLLMPHTATDALRRQVEERGVRTETADVSEFMEKGGGSVKCMIGDLGPLPTEAPSELCRNFRQERFYPRLFPHVV